MFSYASLRRRVICHRSQTPFSSSKRAAQFRKEQTNHQRSPSSSNFLIKERSENKLFFRCRSLLLPLQTTSNFCFSLPLPCPSKRESTVHTGKHERNVDDVTQTCRRRAKAEPYHRVDRLRHLPPLQVFCSRLF